MTLYIKRLVISDETDNVVYEVRNVKAYDGLRKAIRVIEAKDGGGFRGWLHKIDKDFEEAFRL